MATHLLDFWRPLREAITSFGSLRKSTASRVTATWSIDLVVENDELDGGYVIHSPQLKGCWAQGESLEEARTNFSDALDAWFAAQLADAVETAPTIAPHIPSLPAPRLALSA
jgi:predicted RNase H-like HicB family nuclease